MESVNSQRNMAGEDGALPQFVIDLSKKPSERYVELAKIYKPQIHRLTSLFDELLADLGIPSKIHRTINQAARLMLRKVHSSVETEELQGIAAVTGVRMYLLVAFNVILDLLMGCTSGVVKSLEKDQPDSQTGMLHFRTLDWGMDALRSVIVQLDFIKSKEASGDRVLGSSVTYVGFVGVLTGVRERLSLSLNFRAVHNASTKAENFKFHLHHVLVLLGQRQSISSILRSCLYGGTSEDWSQTPKSLASLVDTIPTKHTTAAYLIFSDGQTGVSMEKDYCTAVVRQSQSFIVTTNHDLDVEEESEKLNFGTQTAAMQELLEESAGRRGCVVKKWKSKIQREKRRRLREPKGSGNRNLESTCTEGTSRTMSLRSTRHRTSHSIRRSVREQNPELEFDEVEIEQSVSVTRDELIKWTTTFPTTNECTHYAAILEPRTGSVLWAQTYLRPVESESDEAPTLDADVYLEG